jgi:hypothetical protein
VLLPVQGCCCLCMRSSAPCWPSINCMDHWYCRGGCAHRLDASVVRCCALGGWCAHAWWISAAGWLAPCARVLLPVHAQQVVPVAFKQPCGPLVVLWWLCAAVGCSCGVLLAVMAPYCCWLVSNDCPVVLSSKAGLCWRCVYTKV